MPLRHESLIAWQRADDLFIRLHRLVRERFPPLERYELASQIRRAAYSVAANIVEGFARPEGKARMNFLKISQASLAEVWYGLHVAKRLDYISPSEFDELERALNQIGAPLAGLIRTMRREQKPTDD